MSNLRGLFGTDERAEVEGVWFDYGPVRIKIARAGGANDKMDLVSAEAWKPYRSQIAAGIPLDKKLQREILARVYAKAVVLDWQGVVDDDGKPIPCDEEHVVEELLATKNLFDEVVQQANRLANFRLVERETESKNS